MAMVMVMVVGGGMPGHGYRVFQANAGTGPSEDDGARAGCTDTEVQVRADIAGGFGNLETKWMDPPHATALHKVRYSTHPLHLPHVRTPNPVSTATTTTITITTATATAS